METTANLPRKPSPLREVVAFLAITYSLALALVIALPNAGLNVGLTALFPTVAVVIVTFTMFRRGTRRELWRSLGLGRAGVRSWGWAFGLPILLSGGVFGILLLVGPVISELCPWPGPGSSASPLAQCFSSSLG
jgi:hypothetical protein